MKSNKLTLIETWKSINNQSDNKTTVKTPVPNYDMMKKYHMCRLSFLNKGTQTQSTDEKFAYMVFFSYFIVWNRDLDSGFIIRLFISTFPCFI